jgi:integrase
VFATVTDEQLNPDGVSQRFERLIARSGLPPVRLHDVRHVAATLGLSAGVAMKTVSEQLGHSSIKITSDIYSVPTSFPPNDKSDRATGGVSRIDAGQSGCACDVKSLPSSGPQLSHMRAQSARHLKI